MTLDEALTTIAEHAERLRAGNVRVVVVGDVRVEFGPTVTAAPLDVTEPEPQYAGPFDDPKTYGRPGGRAPGFDPPSDD